MEGGERGQKEADHRNVGSRKVRRSEGTKRATWEDGRTQEKNWKGKQGMKEGGKEG